MHVSSEVGHGYGGCDGVEQLVRVGLLDVQESDGDILHLIFQTANRAACIFRRVAKLSVYKGFPQQGR